MGGDIKIAEGYERKKKWEHALKEYQAIYADNYKNIHVLDKIGWCQSRLEEFNDAIDTYKKIIELEPKKAKWHYTLGYQYYSMKNWSSAVLCFQEAIKYYPDYLIVYYRMGYAIAQDIGNEYTKRLSKLRESLKYLNKYEAIYSKLNGNDKKVNKKDYIKVLFLRGKVLIELNEIHGSIQVLKRAHELERSDKDIAYALSKAYYLNNNLDEASKLFSLLPNRYYTEELKAKVFLKQKRYNEALSILNKVLNFRQRDYIYRDIAEIYLELEDLDNAYKNAKKAVELDRGNHKNTFVLGTIYYKFGLLLLCKKMLLDSIEIKDKKYNSKYEEAQQLLVEIDRLITKKNHTEDSAEVLNHIENLSRKSDKKYMEGKIVEWFENKKYGFIKSETSSYFFHISDVNKKMINYISKERKATFYLTSSDKGTKAIIVNIRT